MRRRRRTQDRTTTGRDCRLCVGTGKIPYMGNHFDLWMVPCTACGGRG